MRILLSLFLVLAAPVFLTGATRADPPIHITFVTDWKAQAEHGGFYEAVAQGLYAKRGLDVTIRAGGPDVNVPLLLIMAIFQKDPQVLISHPRRDINSLADMKGKPILISAATMTSFWPWLRAKYGFKDSQIRKYTNNLAPFLVDPNAIQEGYLTSEPYTIQQQAHFTPKVFLLSDAGYPGYANMVLVTQKWLDTNPKAVQAFFNGTKAGWYDYLNRD